MDIESLIYGLFVLGCGLAFGSFVTLASYRLPRDEDIVVKPSRCPACEAKLDFFDLWPVLSWICTGGRCRHCGSKVSVRYPLTELATGAMFLWLWTQYGLSADFFMLAALWVVLMIMIVVDLEHYLIPDSVHVLLLPLGLAYRLHGGALPQDIVGGFLLGAGIGLSLHHGYRVIRGKEGLGFGDVKFLAVAGMWLGMMPMVPFLFFSGIFGVVLGLVWRALGQGPIFPFGPALGLAMFLCIVSPKAANFFWYIGEIIKSTI